MKEFEEAIEQLKNNELESIQFNGSFFAFFSQYIIIILNHQKKKKKQVEQNQIEKSYDDPILIIAEVLKQNTTLEWLCICKKETLFFL